MLVITEAGAGSLNAAGSFFGAADIGGGSGRPGPQGQATRTQAAQILKNFIENQEDNT